MTLWLPEIDAFEPILNRAEARSHVAQHFTSRLAVLKSITDYGTHLIPRCWVSSPRTIREMVVLPVLLKQIVGMIDAASVQLAEGCVEPSMLQLRSAFEASIYLDWILVSRPRSRARAYYVWNTRRTLRWNLRALNGTREKKAFSKDLAGLTIHATLHTPEKQEELRAEVDRITAHLAQPENAAWNKRFDERRGKRLHDVEWYQVLFKKRRSLAFLARAVKRMPDYRIIYELGSEVMHSSKSSSHVRVRPDGTLGIHSLRELTDMPFVSQMLMGVAFRAYTSALRAYRPQELETFSRKYVEEWRKVFLSSVSVSYQYHEATIG